MLQFHFLALIMNGLELVELPGKLTINRICQVGSPHQSVTKQLGFWPRWLLCAMRACEEKKTDFRAFFLLFTASVRSQPPGPPLVPGVFKVKNQYALQNGLNFL